MPTPEELTIPDKLDSINVTKQAIRQAIADKGVEVPEGTTFYEYAGKIAEIETGSQVQTATVALNDGPNGHYERSISYVNEAGELVTDTQNSVVHLPVPQIIHVDFSGELMASHDYSGEITVVDTWSSSQAVYYVYGDATLTASL